MTIKGNTVAEKKVHWNRETVSDTDLAQEKFHLSTKRLPTIITGFAERYFDTFSRHGFRFYFPRAIVRKLEINSQHNRRRRIAHKS